MLKIVNEEWKDIEGQEGYYMISNLGRLKTIDRVITKSNGFEYKLKGRVIKTHIDKDNGYERTTLPVDGRRKTAFIHRIVAKAFIPNPENKATVNHKNSIRSDNRVENLEWCTYKENTLHAKNKGRLKQPKGVNHVRAKLKESNIQEVYDLYKKGLSKSEIGRRFGISAGAVYHIVHRKTWKHVEIKD